MRFDWWTLALQVVNFAVLVWLLHRFLYKPVLRMIDARKADIQGQYDAARSARENAALAQAAIASERAGIAAEREAALKLAAKQAQELAEARRIQIDREARAVLEATRKTLAAEHELALARARQLAWDLGMEVARRLLAEMPIKLRAEAWLESIEQHLRALPAPALDSLAQQLSDGSTLKVVTPAALPADVSNACSDRLRALLGSNAGVTFSVEPELIAGADLHFPTAVLRLSWASVLEALRSEAGSHANAG